MDSLIRKRTAFVFGPMTTCPGAHNQANQIRLGTGNTYDACKPQSIDLGTIDEMLFFCGISSNDHQIHQVIRRHRIYHWSQFLRLSMEEMVAMGFKPLTATLICQGAHLYVEKLDDSLFDTSGSEDFYDYLP